MRPTAVAPESMPPAPAGLNEASIGIVPFAAALTVAAAWTTLSIWLAAPWAEDLARIIGSIAAWAVIFGIALAPGFMNASQTATLLLKPRQREFRRGPARRRLARRDG